MCSVEVMQDSRRKAEQFYGFSTVVHSIFYCPTNSLISKFSYVLYVLSAIMLINLILILVMVSHALQCISSHSNLNF